MILLIFLILLAILYSTEKGRDFLYSVYLVVILVPLAFLFSLLKLPHNLISESKEKTQIKIKENEQSLLVNKVLSCFNKSQKSEIDITKISSEDDILNIMSEFSQLNEFKNGKFSKEYLKDEESRKRIFKFIKQEVLEDIYKKL